MEFSLMTFSPALDKLKPFTPAIITFCTLVVVVLLLWLSFGVHTVGLIEEWTNKQQMIEGYTFYNAPIGSFQSNRFMMMIPFSIAELFGYDHFIGLVILMIIVFVAKGMCMFALVRQLLPAQPWLAVAAAVLVVIQPGNDAMTPMRLVAYHVAIWAYLAAAACLVAYWRSNNWRYLALMVVPMLFVVGIVESIYPLVAVTPVLLLWLARGQITRRLIWVSALWYALPFVFGVVFLYMFLSGQLPYQNALYDQLQTMSSDEAGFGPLILLRPYYFLLYGGWTQFDPQSLLNPLALAMGALAAAAVVCCTPRTVQTQKSDLEAQVMLFLMGLVAIGVGFALYLLVLHRATTDYVFFFSTIGAALVIVLWGWLAAQRLPYARWFFAVGFGGLVFMAMNIMLGQQTYYYRMGVTQSRILAQVAQLLPNPDAQTQIVTFENNDYQGTRWMFSLGVTTMHYSDAFRWVYGDKNRYVTMCYAERPGAPAQCTFRDGVVQMLRLTGPSDFVPFEVTYPNLIALQINADASVSVLQTLPAEFTNGADTSGYDPQAVIERAQGPLPPRAQYLLEYVLPPTIGPLSNTQGQ
jgi:hypothetical protein